MTVYPHGKSRFGSSSVISTIPVMERYGNTAI